MRSMGVGFNDTEYRSFNRSFRHGNSKPYRKSQRPPSPMLARKGDLFIEAGKLAVEHLVSHGLLSSNAISEKWKNETTLRNSYRELKDHRNRQDKEIPSSPFKERAVQNSKTQNDDDPCMDKVTATQRLKEDTDNGPKDANEDSNTDVQMPHLVESSDDRDRNQMNEMKNDHVEKHSDVIDTEKVDSETKTSMNELDIKQCEDEHDSSNNNSDDLVKASGPETIPTKSPNSDRDIISNEGSTSYSGCDSLEPTKECVTTTLCGPSFREVGGPDTSNDVNRRKQYESMPSEPRELKRVNSSDKNRGEKRDLMEQNIEEGVKRAKQRLSVSQSGDYTQLSDVGEKRDIFPDNRPVSASVFNGSNNENFPNVSVPLKGGVGSSVNQGEKQFFPSSSRICDLNLMGSSDFHENRDVPSTDASVGIDLTMNNNTSLNDMNNGGGSARKGKDKGIEIIDLESESHSQQDGNNMPASMEVGMTNMGNIPNNSQNLTDNPNSQNGYSCMIPDDPNCSSVQPEMSSLHNDISLHHGETLAEEDSIYMSLGEIPISMPDV